VIPRVSGHYFFANPVIFFYLVKGFGVPARLGDGKTVFRPQSSLRRPEPKIRIRVIRITVVK